MVKAIKSDKDYKEALDAVRVLVAQDPKPDTPEADHLEVLGTLIGVYEDVNYPIDLPDAIEAIEFCMDQRNLSRRNLTIYLGSRSKVSEVLSRKRPLTLSMIRALNKGLGIPAKILLQESNIKDTPEIDWKLFPIDLMINRGWLKGSSAEIKKNLSDHLERFFAPLGDLSSVAALCRRTDHIRPGRTVNKFSLIAWTAQVLGKATRIKSMNKFDESNFSADTLRSLSKLSKYDDGPIRVVSELHDLGIAVIIQPHLPKTYLDGASIFNIQENPVIGLTFRYDRIDYFWFTLMHELAHVLAHRSLSVTSIYDDLDTRYSENPLEQEADKISEEALIPYADWIVSPASSLPSPEAAIHLAKKLDISSSIVAGRIRYEANSYQILNNLVGKGELRRMFENPE